MPEKKFNLANFNSPFETSRTILDDASTIVTLELPDTGIKTYQDLVFSPTGSFLSTEISLEQPIPDAGPNEIRYSIKPKSLQIIRDTPTTEFATVRYGHTGQPLCLDFHPLRSLTFSSFLQEAAADADMPILVEEQAIQAQLIEQFGVSRETMEEASKQTPLTSEYITRFRELGDVEDQKALRLFKKNDQWVALERHWGKDSWPPKRLYTQIGEVKLAMPFFWNEQRFSISNEAAKNAFIVCQSSEDQKLQKILICPLQIDYHLIKQITQRGENWLQVFAFYPTLSVTNL